MKVKIINARLEYPSKPEEIEIYHYHEDFIPENETFEEIVSNFGDALIGYIPNKLINAQMGYEGDECMVITEESSFYNMIDSNSTTLFLQQTYWTCLMAIDAQEFQDKNGGPSVKDDFRIGKYNRIVI